MRKLYLTLSVLFQFLYSSAQDILKITSGTDFYISSGSEFSFSGLSFTPSSGFNLNGLVLTKSTTATNTVINTCVSRVFKFSNNTLPYSGTIRFYYNDSELNGLNESAININTHNGTTWQSLSRSLFDVNTNYVQTNSILNIAFNEVALAGISSPLPLSWKDVAAIRQKQTVQVTWHTFQEINTSHYEVERSLDGRNWDIIEQYIKAKNTEGVHSYHYIDIFYQPQQLYYRIKQVDIDGRFTYSKIVSVDEDKISEKPIIYPNPVINTFYIGNCDPLKMKTVQLFSNHGSLLKTWNKTQNGYPIQAFANGTYFIKITMNDGSSQQIIMQKQ